MGIAEPMSTSFRGRLRWPTSAKAVVRTTSAIKNLRPLQTSATCRVSDGSAITTPLWNTGMPKSRSAPTAKLAAKS